MASCARRERADSQEDEHQLLSPGADPHQPDEENAAQYAQPNRYPGQRHGRQGAQLGSHAGWSEEGVQHLQRDDADPGIQGRDEENQISNVAPHQEVRGHDGDARRGGDRCGGCRTEHHDEGHIALQAQYADRQPPAEGDQGEGHHGLADSQQVIGQGKPGEALPLKLQPEVKAHPPQPKSQEGGELIRRLQRKKAQPRGSQSHPDEEEVNARPEQEPGACRDAFRRKGETRSQQGQEDEDQRGE